jgi:hypothetical protein
MLIISIQLIESDGQKRALELQYNAHCLNGYKNEASHYIVMIISSDNDMYSVISIV